MLSCFLRALAVIVTPSLSCAPYLCLALSDGFTGQEEDKRVRTDYGKPLWSKCQLLTWLIFFILRVRSLTCNELEGKRHLTGLRNSAILYVSGSPSS